jgi:hypothetical protein
MATMPMLQPVTATSCMPPGINRCCGSTKTMYAFTTSIVSTAKIPETTVRRHGLGTISARPRTRKHSASVPISGANFSSRST